MLDDMKIFMDQCIFSLTNVSNVNYDDQDYKSNRLNRHTHDIRRNNYFNGEIHGQANNHHNIIETNENTYDEYDS